MRWLFLLLVLSLMLAACEKDTPPEVKSSPIGSAPFLRVTVSEARAFTYPSRDSEVLFRLIEGDEVPVLARTEPDLIGV
ncbi:MAG: hypothetical protein K8I82_11340, partial [Anaerolineae bacterium]|nr:hypothetical protein [Anaerolineae bacterium]